MNAARPTVNVDALGAWIDRLLSHPLAILAEQALPESAAKVRAVRGNLPEALGRLQDEALVRLGAELDRSLSRALTRRGRGKKGARQ
jgi:hypothetical protein